MAAEPPFTEALVLPANIGHNIGVLAFKCAAQFAMRAAITAMHAAAVS